MKKISIKKISAVSTVQPIGSILDTTKGFGLLTSQKAMTGDGKDMIRDLMRSPPDETALPMVPMVRIKLDVDEALPNTNYANFWVDDQLLLGTMLDEQAQQVTGFVHRPVKGLIDVHVEQPDGTHRTFQLYVDSPDAP